MAPSCWRSSGGNFKELLEHPQVLMVLQLQLLVEVEEDLQDKRSWAVPSLTWLLLFQVCSTFFQNQDLKYLFKTQKAVG